MASIITGDRVTVLSSYGRTKTQTLYNHEKIRLWGAKTKAESENECENVVWNQTLQPWWHKKTDEVKQVALTSDIKSRL